MTDPNSRYSNSSILTHVDASGRQVRYYGRRLLPQSAPAALTRVVVEHGDRLDGLSARWLNNPSAWWRLADANEALHPDEVVATTGVRIVSPVPGS